MKVLIYNNIIYCHKFKNLLTNHFEKFITKKNKLKIYILIN